MKHQRPDSFVLAAILSVCLLAQLAGCQKTNHTTPTSIPLPTPTPTLSLPTLEATPVEEVPVRYNETIKFRGMSHEPDAREGYYGLIAEEYGANSMGITHFIEVGYDKGGVFDDIRNKPEDTLKAIDAAHKAGLHVFLHLYPEFFKQAYWEETGKIGAYNNHGPAIDPLTGELLPAELERGPMSDIEGFRKTYTEIVIKWAKLAEEHGVELFAPGCEMNLFLGWDNAAQWWQDILIPLRENYSGELVQKGEISWKKYGLEHGDLSSFAHFKGWDYISTDDIGENQTIDQYISLIHEMLGYMQSLKEKYNAKGIILTEVGVPEDSEMLQKKATTSHEVRIAYWEVLFRETRGLIDGYYFWPWDAQEPPVNPSEKFDSGYSMLALNFFDTPYDQKQAYLNIHQAIRGMDEINYYWKNSGEDPLRITTLENEIAKLKESYLKGEDYARIAVDAADLSRRITDTLTLVIPYSDVLNIRTWLELSGQDDQWNSEILDPLIGKIENEINNDNPAGAVPYAEEARKQLGVYYTDKEGDAPGGVQDLKSVYMNFKNDRLIVLFSVYGDASQGSYSVEADTNLDGERDVIWFLKCSQNSASAIRFSAGQVMNDRPPEYFVCGPDAARMEISGLNLPIRLRPTSDLPQQGGNPQFDELLQQRVTLE